MKGFAMKSILGDDWDDADLDWDDVRDFTTRTRADA
jgi:hypothetical protein